MDEHQEPKYTVRLTVAAEYDLAGVDNSTAITWGVEQAERYLTFLTNVFNDLAQNPYLGSLVEGFPEIRVIRILHSAMNWPEHLSEPPSN
jgi:plasmid stabilization system protein ParE